MFYRAGLIPSGAKGKLVGLAGDFVLVVVAAFLAGALARVLRLPLLLGYIAAGILVGPHTGGPTVSSLDDLEVLADIGVALLLFAVGLEFSLLKLRPVARVALLGTVLQLALSVGVGWGIATVWGWDSRQALWFGCMISLSSTMVALKLFTDWGYASTLSGQVVLGMLVVQDLAAIPMMVLLGGETGVGRSLFMVVAVIAGMLSFGAWVLPRLLSLVARLKSRELFLVAVMCVGLGVGYLTYLLGLSFALGAFLAGVVLAESDFSHHALGTIEPLRDVFGMLFFASVGMLLDLEYLRNHLLTVVSLLVLVMLGKGLIFAFTTRLFGYRKIIPLATGLGLAQIGEFSFVMARTGFEAGQLNPDLYRLTLILATLSMILTPPIAGLAGPLYRLLRRYRPDAKPHTGAPPPPTSDHAVVAGYGRVGTFVCKLLRSQGRECYIVELDWLRYQAARDAGFRVVFGDLGQTSVAEAVHLDKAEICVLTGRDPSLLYLTAQAVRREHPKMVIVSSAVALKHVSELAAIVDEVVLPDLEAGLELARQALLRLGSDPTQVADCLDQVRRSHYSQQPEGNGIAGGVQGDAMGQVAGGPVEQSEDQPDRQGP